MNYRLWLFIAIFLFGTGIILGLSPPAFIASMLKEEIAALRELSAMLGPFKITTALFIYVKNISALILSFAFSPLLCLVPVLSLVTNGWLISFVSVTVLQQKSIWFLLAGILPHGVFELPALIMGEAAALGFGATAIMALFSQEKRKQLLPVLKQSLRYLVIAAILLVPAAIIETYVTPLLIR